MKKSWFVIKMIKMGVFGSLFIAGLAFAVMYLWNILIPEIFGLETITWLQALGLLALSKILLSSWKPCGKGGSGVRKHYWKHKFKEKWSNMTPEEKLKWDKHFDDNCGSSIICCDDEKVE